jgi:CheY-like chemotaxis protein
MSGLGSILLVEDNPDDERMTLRALERNHIINPVAVARDGPEALARLLGNGDSAPSELPSIVLLDLNLPKVSGLEVLTRVRGAERTRSLPVVVLTSSREEQDLISSYRLGANSFIRKPVDFSKFVEAVRQLGLSWMVVGAPPSSGDERLEP